ncbi:hypothetical protein [Pseudomonas syringae]|uniref:hypothetical protein n=1 Tax=Pseudomonas syringae TaxID=317 RepID=UPI0012AED756|nr:hypothetical protein [Pseudomonas syringae]
MNICQPGDYGSRQGSPIERCGGSHAGRRFEEKKSVSVWAIDLQNRCRGKTLDGDVLQGSTIAEFISI